ncbi:CAMK/CAMK2 protein kinase [Phytophthora nicotianae P1976]|uniref:CAMK/CAMK2 protein kinase n=1 Tax=Phytophthora nicotianae P1976 TaxID=1317066 RepID=A0A080Z3S8_PHYNI|nr:CAMK/CAMK2 protein kinase [Phytophthora nicotianae P1976]
MADLVPSPSQLSPCHEPEPSTPLTPDKKQRHRTSDASSPTSTAAASEASTCMASPSFMFEADPASKRDGRASSAGSSDFDELGDAQVQQLPARHKEMPHLDLNKPENTPSLSYQGVLSPRQQSGKRYHGGYLQHRVTKAAGLLKSWKRKYFRLREHGLVCYKTKDAATPLFEVIFTSNSMLEQDKNHGDHAPDTPKRHSMTDELSEKRRRTWTSSSGSLTLILKHVKITGHKTPAKAVEVPVILKADDEDDHAAWTECIRFMIEARKRALLQVTQDTDEMPLPSESPSDRSVSTDSTSMVKSVEEVGTFDAFSAKYMLMKEIGEGSFSIVHRAVNRMTGQVCAVKCCKISQALEEEERLLRTLSHPNVVGLEGVYARDANLHYVVMDYLKDGDLCDQLIERQRLAEPEARRIIRQVVEGLAYLHRRCVLHRDIKPENILIHGNMVKIADFGLAKQLEHSTSMLRHSCGTLEYAAPELLCGRPYGLKSDVFSLGIVLYVLLFGAFPFSVESAAALQCMDHFPTGVDVRDMSCLSLSNAQWRTVSPLAQDALLKMLKTNDTERISAEDLLSHPWINEVDVGASIARELERTRIEDCEALGFAELLSRGFQVVKYGYKNSTTPHSTALTFNFMEESITWTARKNAMPRGANSNETGTSGSSKRGRTIPLREITEIKVGHATEAFLSLKDSQTVPSPELCLSIICPWRTLDLVVEIPSQREFMVRGLRRLLPNHSP